MAEYYNYIKSLHLIFVVTWFAGLFYMPRLFIYHIEAGDKPDAAREVLSSQFRIMEKRLWYIITWPSAILCTLFALGLLVAMPSWLSQPWMHVKLGFVVSDIQIVANKKFMEDNPAAVKFFEVFSLPLNDINEQNTKMNEGEKSQKDIERHVDEWIAANNTTWNGWLKAARDAAK